MKRKRVTIKAFIEGDVYIDYPYEDVKFRFEKETGKVYQRWYGGRKWRSRATRSSITSPIRAGGQSPARNTSSIRVRQIRSLRSRITRLPTPPSQKGNIMKEVTKEEFKAIFIKYGKSQLPPKGEGYWNQVYEPRLKDNMRYIVRLPESPEEDQMMIVEDGNEIRLFFMTDDRVEAFFDFPGKDEL